MGLRITAMLPAAARHGTLRLLCPHGPRGHMVHALSHVSFVFAASGKFREPSTTSMERVAHRQCPLAAHLARASPAALSACCGSQSALTTDRAPRAAPPLASAAMLTACAASRSTAAACKPAASAPRRARIAPRFAWLQPPSPALGAQRGISGWLCGWPGVLCGGGSPSPRPPPPSPAWSGPHAMADFRRLRVDRVCSDAPAGRAAPRRWCAARPPPRRAPPAGGSARRAAPPPS